jgi:hypothetical protein
MNINQPPSCSLHEYSPSVLVPVPAFQQPTGTSKCAQIISEFIEIKCRHLHMNFLKNSKMPPNNRWPSSSAREARQLFTRGEMIKGKIHLLGALLRSMIDSPSFTSKTKGNFKFFQCSSFGPAHLSPISTPSTFVCPFIHSPLSSATGSL